MMQSARSRKVGAIAALVVSWCALFWLFWIIPRVPHSVLSRLGCTAAFICVLGGFAFFFGVCLSYVARWRKWSPRKCHVAGISILIPLGIMCFFVPRAHVVPAFDWAACLWVVSGYICGKLAHPGLTDEEAYAPEPPLTLFPK